MLKGVVRGKAVPLRYLMLLLLIAMFLFLFGLTQVEMDFNFRKVNPRILIQPQPLKDELIEDDSTLTERNTIDETEGSDEIEEKIAETKIAKVSEKTKQQPKKKEVKTEDYWRDRMQLDEEDELIKTGEETKDDEPVHSETDHNRNNLGQNGPHEHSLYSKDDPSNPFAHVNTFVMFIGYPRSGHTLVGSFLDAHPHIIIAHEYNVLEKALQGAFSLEKKEELFQRLAHQSLEFHKIGHMNVGYNYHIPNQWQGRWNNSIYVVGDKRGGATTRTFVQNFELAKKAMKALEDAVGLPFRWIHVVRNPFDNIATIALRSFNAEKTTTEWKNNTGVPEELLKAAVKEYFSLAEMNDKLHYELPGKLLDIIYEDFVKEPRAGLRNLCKFLGQECSDDYIRDCVSIVYASPRRSRFLIEWPSHIRLDVERRMKKINFLSKYSWDST